MRIGNFNFFVLAYPQCAIPIFTPEGRDSFRPWGSAVAIIFRGRFLIVTAEHVVRDHEPLIGVSPSTITNLKGTWFYDSRRAMDLAMTVISPDLAAGIQSTGVQFAMLDEETAQSIMPGRELTFVGFAGQEQHQFPFPGGMQVEPIINKVRGVQVTTSEIAALGNGYSIDRHIVSRFRHKEGRPPEKEFYRRGNLISPRGMSGGPIWLGTYPFYSFAGVIAEWNPDGEAGHLIGSNLPALLEFLKVHMGSFD